MQCKITKRRHFVVQLPLNFVTGRADGNRRGHERIAKDASGHAAERLVRRVPFSLHAQPRLALFGSPFWAWQRLFAHSFCRPLDIALQIWNFQDRKVLDGVYCSVCNCMKQIIIFRAASTATPTGRGIPDILAAEL